MLRYHLAVTSPYVAIHVIYPVFVIERFRYVNRIVRYTTQLRRGCIELRKVETRNTNICICIIHRYFGSKIRTFKCWCSNDVNLVLVNIEIGTYHRGTHKMQYIS